MVLFFDANFFFELKFEIAIAICILLYLCVELYFNFFSLRVLLSSMFDVRFSLSIENLKVEVDGCRIFFGYKNSQTFFKISIFFYRIFSDYSPRTFSRFSRCLGVGL